MMTTIAHNNNNNSNLIHNSNSYYELKHLIPPSPSSSLPLRIKTKTSQITKFNRHNQQQQLHQIKSSDSFSTLQKLPLVSPGLENLENNNANINIKKKLLFDPTSIFISASGAKTTATLSGNQKQQHQIVNTVNSTTVTQDPNLDPVDGIVSLLSAIYCKILVVIGLCFPMAEVISHRIPISWYEGFYLYLYTMSIVFLIFVYIFLLNHKRKPTHGLKICTNYVTNFWNNRIINNNNNSGGGKQKQQRNRRSNPNLNRQDSEHNRTSYSGSGPSSSSSSSSNVQYNLSSGSSSPSVSATSFCSESSLNNNNKNSTDEQSLDEEFYSNHQNLNHQQQIQCGSFYLRVGAVAFGIGSMIYSGLEFGQFFELESKEHCYSFMYGLIPGSHMIFTFIQLYFIFMNSRVVIGRHKLIGKLIR